MDAMAAAPTPTGTALNKASVCAEPIRRSVSADWASLSLLPLSDPHRAKLIKPRVLIHPRAAPSLRFEVKHGPGVLF